MEAKGYAISDLNLLGKVVLSLRERVKTLEEMADLAAFYFCREIAYDQKAAEKFLTIESLPVFEALSDRFSREAAVDKGTAHLLIQRLAETRGEPLVKIAQPIRVALTGRTVSPPIDEVMEVLGKKEVIKRLEKAIRRIG